MGLGGWMEGGGGNLRIEMVCLPLPVLHPLDSRGHFPLRPQRHGARIAPAHSPAHFVFKWFCLVVTL